MMKHKLPFHSLSLKEFVVRYSYTVYYV